MGAGATAASATFRAIAAERWSPAASQPSATKAEPAGELLFGLVSGSVQVGAVDAAPMQLGDPARGDLHQLFVGAELDRVGRAGLRACRLESILEAVITERALAGTPVLGVAVDHPERTGRHAVAATVADVGLQHDRLILGPDQGAGGAGVETARIRAVLADVRHEHPIVHLAHRLGDVHDAGRALGAVDEVEAAGGRDRRQHAPGPGFERAPGLLLELRRGLEQLDEPYVTPAGGREVPGVIV